MASISAAGAKLFGHCFSCKGSREFTPTEQRPAKNKSTDINIGSCISCGKKVSTISKRAVNQTADSNNDNSIVIAEKVSKRKRSKQSKAEEPAKVAKAEEPVVAQSDNNDAVAEVKQ